MTHKLALTIVLWLRLCLYTLSQDLILTIVPGSEVALANRDEWEVLVNNTLNQPVSVYFKGVGTESTKGRLYEVISNKRIIEPGITTFNTEYFVGLEPFDILYEDETLRQYAVKTNGLPAGDYEVCLYAISSVDDTELGSTCYQFTVDYFTPPILVAPADGEVVSEPYPFFSWLPPVPGNGQNFTYTLHLFELQNKQTAISAMQTNPAYYKLSGIPSTIVQYGINARNLREGYQYAWRITGEINNQTVTTSEVWTFLYSKDKNDGGGDNNTSSTNSNSPIPGVQYLTLRSETGNSWSMLDRGLLSFMYVHNNNTPTAGMRIMDVNGKMIFNKILDVNFGQNYFSSAITEYGVLQPGELYELQIVDMNGTIQKIRFKFKL